VAEQFRIEPLSGDHDRAQFSSGSDLLDRYFREQAAQDIKRRVAACFVAVGVDTGQAAGFYTLTAAGIALNDLSPEIVRKLPRYPVVPAALLGRLAIARNYQGKGLGSILLANAVIRAAPAEMGVFALLVDAKDEAAQRFYEHYEFMLLSGAGRRLYLPISMALKRFIQPGR
jgi:GNAT superfamily N-acetyltransferase